MSNKEKQTNMLTLFYIRYHVFLTIYYFRNYEIVMKYYDGVSI